MASSSTHSRSTAASSANAPLTSAPTAGEKSFFETQREVLVSEIAISLEHVLQNMNKLNRSLEGVIAVGNEFSSVEALWSQFENVMWKDPNAVDIGGDRSSSREGDEEEMEDTTITSGG